MKRLLLVGAFLVSTFIPAYADGPACTPTYPRGFKMTKVTKKHPVCTRGIFQETWGGCVSRYPT